MTDNKKKDLRLSTSHPIIIIRVTKLHLECIRALLLDIKRNRKTDRWMSVFWIVWGVLLVALSLVEAKKGEIGDSVVTFIIGMALICIHWYTTRREAFVKRSKSEVVFEDCADDLEAQVNLIQEAWREATGGEATGIDRTPEGTTKASHHPID